MKTILFLAVALLAAPSLDAQDHYLQPQNPPADYPTRQLLQAAELRADAEAAELAKHYEEMTDYEIMRGLVYEPTGDER